MYSLCHAIVEFKLYHTMDLYVRDAVELSLCILSSTLIMVFGGLVAAKPLYTRS